MELTAESIEERIQRLIKDSCAFNERPTPEFERFHIAFLKFALGVLNVEMDYENKKIITWNSKPLDANSIGLHSLGKDLVETVNYVDLEDTLLGCMREEFSTYFYRHLLMEFGRLRNNDDAKTA